MYSEKTKPSSNPKKSADFLKGHKRTIDCVTFSFSKRFVGASCRISKSFLSETNDGLMCIIDVSGTQSASWQSP